MSVETLTVYGFSVSGNCHKVRLLLEQLQIPYQWIEVDSPNGATRTPEYLAKNPNGRVPMIERADGSLLAESNAILCWLADSFDPKGSFLPADEWQRAQALSWLFFEQYSHEPYVAVARFIRGWAPLDSPRRADLPRLIERGEQALAVMEKHLQSKDWFTGADYGVADIALYAYTHCAEDGGFDLGKFPQITNWLSRVFATPGFVHMPSVSDDVAARLAAS
ncbi:glutathione S-transferase family protein [Pseudoxanthomonas sp. UTMC 1351]|uniref:glutathione S-transferase family protein n=1 Tax=Pseudoxanthomonas sp. UTMC 1351 TaxID=2695853 RepID=UPI0034CD599A